MRLPNPIQGHGTDAAPAGQAEKGLLLWGFAGAAPSEQGDAETAVCFCQCQTFGGIATAQGPANHQRGS